MIASRALSTDDLRRLAKRRLPKVIYDYLEGGAEDEDCLERICTAFRDQCFIPRYLVDIAERYQSCSLFGDTYASPFGVAPMGMLALTTPDADILLARAAHDANVPF